MNRHFRHFLLLVDDSEAVHATSTDEEPLLNQIRADTSSAAMVNPLFTCFGSANEGVPLNPSDAFYYQTKPDSYGFIANPYGFGYRVLGLGTLLAYARGGEQYRYDFR